MSYLLRSIDYKMKNNLLVADSAKKNFVFQCTYQAVILIIPLFVSPYLTRTLGSTSLGIYTYTYSIAYYFVMFAMLGINRHGQRIIASRRNDILKLRKTFWSLYFVHLVTSFLAIVAYIAYCAFICSSDTKIAFAQTIYVTSAALDITWLFYGLEKFKIVAIRNAVIRIAECACIFLLVKSPSDVGIYTIIMCTSTCLGHAIMMPQVIHAIKPIRFGLNDVKEHLKPMITLFAAVVASSLYTMFDKTLLGLLSSKDNVAFYEYSNKIIAIPRTFITVISTVLFPRACQLASKRDYNGMKNTMDQALIVTAFIGFAACFGLVSIADLFAVLYYGEDFAICGNVISCMSPMILIIGIGEAVRTQYLYPLKKMV